MYYVALPGTLTTLNHGNKGKRNMDAHIKAAAIFGAAIAAITAAGVPAAEAFDVLVAVAPDVASGFVAHTEDDVVAALVFDLAAVTA